MFLKLNSGAAASGTADVQARGGGKGSGGGDTGAEPTAPRYSAVYSLGDSLIDAGNILGLARWFDGLPFQDAPEGTPLESLGYFEGRFSDGYTFADLVTNKYTGTPSEPIFPFGYEDPVFGFRIAPFAPEPKGNNTNWAYGGAQIRSGGAIPDLDDQTDALRDARDGAYAADALFLVTIGGNDVRELAPSNADPADAETAFARLQRAADELFDEMREIVARGGKHFFIAGLPDVGIIPRYDLDGDRLLDAANLLGGTSEQERAAAATKYAAHLDALIRDEVIPGLEALGATVTYVPLASTDDETGALEAILPTIAETYGIALEDLRANLLDYQETIFFDLVHPNAQVHALVGSLIHATLEGEAWVETAPLTGEAVDFSQAGSIETAGEVDRIKVSLVKGETYRIEMLGVSSTGEAGDLADPFLALRDPRGRTFEEFLDGSGDDAGLGFDAVLEFTATRSGSWTIEASASGALTGDYLVQVGAIEVSAPLAIAPDPVSNVMLIG